MPSFDWSNGMYPSSNISLRVLAAAGVNFSPKGNDRKTAVPFVELRGA